MTEWNFRFRTNWRGKLILQVLRRRRDLSEQAMYVFLAGTTVQWEDATVADLEQFYCQEQEAPK